MAYGDGTYGSGLYGGQPSPPFFPTPVAQAAQATIYRYLFYDLLTNAPLADLPLKKVSFDKRLNEVGSFTGQLPIGDPRVQKLQPWASITPNRTALYVDRGGRIVWAGIVVPRRYSQGDKVGGTPLTIEVNAAETMYYFRDKRIIAADTTFSAVDQLTIAQSLVNTAQGVRNGNIGLQVPSNVSGITRTQTWLGSERKKVGQALIELSQLDQGFDWRIDVDYGLGGQPAGVPGKQLVLGYPRVGEPWPTTGWMFEFPGNVADYDWEEDGSQQAITAYVQGGGSGPTMAASSSSVTALLDAGFPQLDEVFQAKDQTDPNVIAARAVAAAKAYSSPVALPKILVRADQDPVFGSYALGDDCLLRITSPQFPASGGSVGYSGYWRIIEMRVQPQDDTTAERVLLTLGAVPA